MDQGGGTAAMNNSITLASINRSDAEEEGQWRDYYSGQQVSQEVIGEAGGGLEGGRTQNCGIVS